MLLTLRVLFLALALVFFVAATFWRVETHRFIAAGLALYIVAWLVS